ncbi:MAG: transposase, partial [Candidatus Jordarchaeaceae archaeon]
WEASIATSKGRISLKIMHGTYHEKFKGMRVGEAWLTRKKGDVLYLRVVFSLEVEEAEPNGEAVAVDLNENNVTFGSQGSNVKKFETGERTIRTAYFLKRRRLQSEPRLNEKAAMEKYRGRERRRMDAVYHRAAKEVVCEAKEEGASVIVLENLKGIRGRMNYSKQMNGRLHRWSFRRLQSVVEYKAKLAGLTVVYVDARGTSSLCPECGVHLRRSLRGYRLMRCPKCGMEEDRDVIAVRNLLLKYKVQRDVPASSVLGRTPPHEMREEDPKVTEVNAGSERVVVPHCLHGAVFDAGFAEFTGFPVNLWKKVGFG